MTKIRKASILLFFTILLCGVPLVNVIADTPSCECDKLYDTGSLEWHECNENGCTGVDAPVTGNLWVLALAGFVFAFVKFGGHTKLAGYYYSKKEKQE